MDTVNKRPRAAWVAVLVALAACASGASGDAGGTTGSTSGAGAGGSDAGPQDIACSLGMPCAAAQTCVNGVCAAGCNSNKDCGPGKYCALSNGQVCLDETLAACPAVPCQPSQVCVDGICGTVPTGNPCGPSPFDPKGDGCPPNALCLQNVMVDGVLKTDPTCYVLPGCTEANTCSPGGAGALCNDGLIPEKNKLCIPGGCQTAVNCPTTWKCIQVGTMKGYGTCTDGQTGQPCGMMTDCMPGLACHTPIADQPGTCM